MAHPKWHFWPTLILCGVSAVVYTPMVLYSHNTFSIIGVWLFGFFMDLDHLSIRRIKKIYGVIRFKRKEAKGPVEGWVNWMHTWYSPVIVIIYSTIIWNFMPLASYVIHILIDGGNRDNFYHTSPLPEYLHRFYPRRWTYSTGLII